MPRPAVVRVAEAKRRLVGRAAANELLVRQLPQPLAGEQAGLDHLGEPVAALILGQRGEQRGVDHGARRPVEGANEVLRLRQVDRRLSADRGVDLADEARRHRHPVEPAHVRRSGEAGEVGRRPAAERDDRPGPLEAQRAPQPRELLGGLARDLMRRGEPAAELGLDGGAVDAGDMRVGDERDRPVAGDELTERLDRAESDVDPGRSEDGVVDVPGGGVGDLSIDRQPLVVEGPERSLLLGERSAAAAHPLPRRAGVDLDMDRQRVLAQRGADRGARDGAAAECDHGRLAAAQLVDRRRLLEHAELRLPPPRGLINSRRFVALR